MLIQLMVCYGFQSTFFVAVTLGGSLCVPFSPSFPFNQFRSLHGHANQFIFRTCSNFEGVNADYEVGDARHLYQMFVCALACCCCRDFFPVLKKSLFPYCIRRCSTENGKCFSVCIFFGQKLSIIWVFVVGHTVTAFHIDFTSFRSLFGVHYCAWSFSAGKCVHNGTASNDTFVDFLTTLFECFENTPKLDYIVCRWCMVLVRRLKKNKLKIVFSSRHRRRGFARSVKPLFMCNKRGVS